MAEHEPPPAPAGLQLDHAEFEQPAAAAVTCAQCQQPVGEQYYEAGGRTLCDRCRRQIEADLASGSALGRFVRAALFGSVAGVGGAIVWYAIRKMSNSEWGLIAILVGWMVGTGVRVGARGRGGWPYQLLALLLTYVSIAGNYFPDAFQAFGQPAANGDVMPGPVRAIAAALLALAAPFLGGFENIIGLLIIGFGLYQAWQMNKHVELRFNGPFRVGSAPPPPAPAASA